MKYCADSWFIIYLFDKDEQSLSIFRETKNLKTNIVIPIIVYAESTKKLFQRGVPLSIIDQFWSGIESSRKIEIMPIDKSICMEAAKISLTFNIPLIDSIVASTCKLTDCDILLSGDQDYKFLARKRYIKVQSW